jgi:hypothetical protein
MGTPVSYDAHNAELCVLVEKLIVRREWIETARSFLSMEIRRGTAARECRRGIETR